MRSFAELTGSFDSKTSSSESARVLLNRLSDEKGMSDFDLSQDLGCSVSEVDAMKCASREIDEVTRRKIKDLANYANRPEYRAERTYLPY